MKQEKLQINYIIQKEKRKKKERGKILENFTDSL